LTSSTRPVPGAPPQHLQELDAKLVAHHRGLPEVRALHERVVVLNT